MDTLTARMPNPAVIIPEAMKPIQALFGSVTGVFWLVSGWGPARGADGGNLNHN